MIKDIPEIDLSDKRLGLDQKVIELLQCQKRIDLLTYHLQRETEKFYKLATKK